MSDASGDLFLGVDGGATRTRAVVVDAGGVERGRGEAGGANQSAIGAQAAADAVRDAAAGAVAAASGGVLREGAIRAAWVGLAGVDRPADRAVFAPLLAPLAPTVRLSNDAALGLSALPGGVGVMLVAGTGAIALGANAAGETARASGWGWVLGDEGSGYWLGLQALRAATRAADGREPPTTLLPALLAHLHLPAASDLIGWTYGERDNAKIAALAPVVFAAARGGDAMATVLVAEAASELAHAAATVAGALGLAGALPLALGGGLLLHGADFREEVLRQLRQDSVVAPLALVEDAALSAARGAITLAADAAGAAEGAGA